MPSSPYRQPSAPGGAASASTASARRALGAAFWLVCGGVALAAFMAAAPSRTASAFVVPPVPPSRKPPPLFPEEVSEPDEVPPPADDSASGRITPNVLERINGGIRVRCWDHIRTKATSANIEVAVTIAPDGRVVAAKATGNEPAVGMCLEREVMGWVFPKAAKSTYVDLPFHFVRQ